MLDFTLPVPILTADHAVGDTVWVMYGNDFNSEPYPATIVSVVDYQQSKCCGVHYVIHVDTNIDDYLDLRSAHRVWKTRADWEAARKNSIRQRQEFNERINAAKKKLKETNEPND